MANSEKRAVKKPIKKDMPPDYTATHRPKRLAGRGQAADPVAIVELCERHRRPALIDRLLRERVTTEEAERRLQAAAAVDRLCAVSGEAYPRIAREAREIGDILNNAGCGPEAARAVLEYIEAAVRSYDMQENEAHARGDVSEH